MNDEKVNSSLAEWLAGVPSYKFVGLLYQLCARMVTEQKEGVHAKTFPKLLMKQISR
jgi:hypothetical protein